MNWKGFTYQGVTYSFNTVMVKHKQVRMFAPRPVYGAHFIVYGERPIMWWKAFPPTNIEREIAKAAQLWIRMRLQNPKWMPLVKFLEGTFAPHP